MKRREKTPEERAKIREAQTKILLEKKKNGTLSKLGEWLLSEEGREGFGTIGDMKAVLR